MTDSSETFQTTGERFLYEPGKDPTSLVLSKTGFQKFEVFKHRDVNSVVFLNHRQVKQMHRPREVLVSDNSAHVAGFIGEKPGSAVVASFDKVDMLDWYPSYMDADPTYPLPQGTQTINELTHFNQAGLKPGVADCRACYTPLWFVKQNGFPLETPLRINSYQDISQEVDEMGGHETLLKTMYWAQLISDNSVAKPTTTQLPTGTYDTAKSACLNFRIITQDDVEWFGEDNWKMMLEEKAKLSGSQTSTATVAPPPVQHQHQAGSQNPLDRQILLELVKQKGEAAAAAAAQKKADKKLTLAKTQAINTWRILFGDIREKKIVLADLTQTYEQLLEEKKSERVGTLRNVLSAKQREMNDSKHYILSECWFPPINNSAGELLHDGEFAGTHGDDPLQLGLTILHFKAPDIESEAYKNFMAQVSTVEAEERVDEDSRKRTSKTSGAYSSGREATKEDVAATFANFLGVADCFVDLELTSKDKPDSCIGKLAYEFADIAKSANYSVWSNAAMKSKKFHVHHSLLAYFGNVLRAMVSLAKDIRLQNLIIDTTQTEVHYDTAPFARVLQEGYSILHKYRTDMSMNSYYTLEVIPGTFNLPHDLRKRLKPNGGRGNGGENNHNQNNNINNNNGNQDEYNLLVKFGSKVWPYLPEGLGWCKFSVLSNKKCKKRSCNWTHPRIQDVTKEQGEKFHKGWQAAQQYKPTPAFQRHLDSLGCNLAAPSPGGGGNNRNRNGGNPSGNGTGNGNRNGNGNSGTSDQENTDTSGAPAENGNQNQQTEGTDGN